MHIFVFLAYFLCLCEANFDAGARTVRALSNSATELCGALSGARFNVSQYVCNTNGETFTYVHSDGVTSTGQAAITGLTNIALTSTVFLVPGNANDRVGCDVDSVLPYFLYDLRRGGIVTGSIEVDDTAGLNNGNPRACGSYIAEWILPTLVDKTLCLRRFEVSMTPLDSLFAPLAQDNCGVAGFP